MNQILGYACMYELKSQCAGERYYFYTEEKHGYDGVRTGSIEQAKLYTSPELARRAMLWHHEDGPLIKDDVGYWFKEYKQGQIVEIISQRIIGKVFP